MRWQGSQALAPLAAGVRHSEGAVCAASWRALLLFKARLPIASQAIAL